MDLGDDPDTWRDKDGRAWRIGTAADLTWIRENTGTGMAITTAIPPVFEAYATVQLPVTPNASGWVWDEPPDRHEASVLGVLRMHTAGQPWWLGYLITGLDAEAAFHDIPKVLLYGWRYALIQAGPEQAGSWRATPDPWKGALPNLMFPADRSWLVSTMWDDYYACIGGPRSLIETFLVHPDLGHRVVEVDPSMEDVTPPKRAET